MSLIISLNINGLIRVELILALINHCILIYGSPKRLTHAFYLNHTFTKCFIVLFTSILMGATLKDVGYSVKQNGIMVNLDYTEPIDDDIIGWKSDRGWVYLIY